MRSVPHLALMTSLLGALTACHGGEINVYDVTSPSDDDPGSFSPHDPHDPHVDPPPSDPLEPDDPNDPNDPVVPPEPQCSQGDLWPVDTPLRQLGHDELFTTVIEIFYGDLAHRIPERYAIGEASVMSWLLERNVGALRALPAQTWSEDSFINRASKPSPISAIADDKMVRWLVYDNKLTESHVMFGKEGHFRDRDGGVEHFVDLPGWSPCEPDEREATDEELHACGEEIVDVIVPRLIRRPFLDDTEREDYVSFMRESVEKFLSGSESGWPRQRFQRGVARFLEGTLSGPDVLYRAEMGTPSPFGHGLAKPLSSYELATRLSYFFLKAPPDAELRALAEDGSLLEDDVLDAQARRLLREPRARPVMNSFFKGWLKLEKLHEIEVNQWHDPVRQAYESFTIPEVHPIIRDYLERCTRHPDHNLVPRPHFRTHLIKMMRKSVLRYVDWAFWEADSFEEFISGRHVYSNAMMSAAFDWPAVAPSEFTLPAPPDGPLACQESGHPQAYVDYAGAFERGFLRSLSDFERIELPEESKRRGITTQPGVLAMTTHDELHSPILRGTHILNALLCMDVAFPGDIDPAESDVEPCTTRQQIEETHSPGGCQVCHGLIDGLGFAYEHFDKIGAYREMETYSDGDEPCAIEAFVVVPSSTLNQTIDVAGGYDHAGQLAEQFATSHQVKSCMTSHLMRYALGRKELRGIGGTPAQRACQDQQIEALVADFDTSGNSMQELVIALVKSPAFRSKATPALPSQDNQEEEGGAQ